MARVTVGTGSGRTVELYYEDLGTGPPVVLVHGWPLTGRSWEPQIIPLVTAGYRVLTYDRRGFGGSSRPSEGYGYDTLTQDLAVLLAELDLWDVTLVGAGMGGGEVARYLGTYGDDRIARAVFAAAVPPYLRRADDNPGGGLDDAAVAAVRNALRSGRSTFLDGVVTDIFRTGPRSVAVGEALRTYHATLAGFAPLRALDGCLTAWACTDFRGDLAEITVPTLVVHGTADRVVPFAVSGRRTHEAVRHSRLLLVANAPHGLNITHAERFNQALLDFLHE